MKPEAHTARAEAAFDSEREAHTATEAASRSNGGTRGGKREMETASVADLLDLHELHVVLACEGPAAHDDGDGEEG